MQLEITEAQKKAILDRCLTAVRNTEGILGKLTPRNDLLEDITGDKSIRYLPVLFGVIAGIVSLMIWNWAFETFNLGVFVRSFGIPAFLADSIPHILALTAAAGTSWRWSYAWGVEGRRLYINQAFNAHERAMIIHSVVEELADILPNAVPDLDDFAHNYDDDRPNNLVEIALGRRKPIDHLPTARVRAEPPLTGR